MKNGSDINISLIILEKLFAGLLDILVNLDAEFGKCLRVVDYGQFVFLFQLPLRNFVEGVLWPLVKPDYRGVQ
jgi:hypothetical protein